MITRPIWRGFFLPILQSLTAPSLSSPDLWDYQNVVDESRMPAHEYNDRLMLQWGQILDRILASSELEARLLAEFSEFAGRALDKLKDSDDVCMRVDELSLSLFSTSRQMLKLEGWYQDVIEAAGTGRYGKSL